MPPPLAAMDGVRLHRPDDAAWDEVVERAGGSAFHLAGYHRYVAASSEGEPYLAVAGDAAAGVAWPYLLRPLDGLAGAAPGATDVTSVYGYPGPVAWGMDPGGPAAREALAAIVETWRRQGAVSAFTRFHPLLGNVAVAEGLHLFDADGTVGDEPGADVLPDGVLRAGWTVSMDLRQDLETVRRAYGRGLGRAIARGREAGLRTVVDEAWDHLPSFVAQYHADMARLGADPFYFFTEADFRRLRAELPGRVHLIATLLGDTVAAAGLFMDSADHLEWHLVATNADLRELSPAKVLVDDAVAWARDRGAVALHMGGGRGSAEDSLFFFKSRFSPLRHPFHVGRWVLDREAYAALAAERAATLAEGESLAPGYFPAYRAGVVRPGEDAAGEDGASGPGGVVAPGDEASA